MNWMATYLLSIVIALSICNSYLNYVQIDGLLLIGWMLSIYSGLYLLYTKSLYEDKVKTWKKEYVESMLRIQNEEYKNILRKVYYGKKGFLLEEKWVYLAKHFMRRSSGLHVEEVLN